jgi:diguanylate cyclase (GGDEF)-like protein
MKPPIPENEEARLLALRSYQILDTPGEQEYDDITFLASQICGTPIAMISLVDENRQWFKSKIGIDVAETPRDLAFCAYAVLSPSKTLVINDALEDERFADNPLVTGDPNIRFYAGAPLVTPENFTIGTLCVIDREPRQLTDQQLKSLQALARQVTMKLELRRMSLLLQDANEDLRNLSLTDDLTGLYNRRGFMFHAEQQLKLFRSRKTDRSLWMMMLDMDGLKKINDTFGHSEGSFAIIELGKILKNNFRDSDVISRFGGDEFVVLIINTLDEVKEKISERLQKNLEQFNANSGKPYEIAASFGLVPIDFDGKTTVDDALKEADDAMYQHKRSRKAARL